MSNSVDEAARYIREHTDTTPDVVLVLGSGLNGLAQSMSGAQVINYEDIPHFGKSGAPGHAGALIIGQLHGQNVTCMQGRLHAYEGFSAEDIVLPLRALYALGAKKLLLTNASGAINANFSVGDLMLVTDHINFTAMNPLTISKASGLDHFVDMSHAYASGLQALAQNAAAQCNIELRQGVYLGLRGPNFETPAEIRAFRTWGADAVGMSTVLEAIAAAALGMEVCCISMMSNMAAGMLDVPLSGDDVIEAAQLAAGKMERLLTAMLQQLPGAVAASGTSADAAASTTAGAAASADAAASAAASADAAEGAAASADAAAIAEA